MYTHKEVLSSQVTEITILMCLSSFDLIHPINTSLFEAGIGFPKPSEKCPLTSFLAADPICGAVGFSIAMYKAREMMLTTNMIDPVMKNVKYGTSSMKRSFKCTRSGLNNSLDEMYARNNKLYIQIVKTTARAILNHFGPE